MFEHQGVWLPSGEKHFPDWMTKNGEIVNGRGTYQIKKFRAAMERVGSFRTAVDVGAHVGLWSMHLAKLFQTVHAFEPMEAFRNCFKLNVPENNVLLYACALGAASGRVTMHYNPEDSGDTHVAFAGGDSKIPMMTLDEFDFRDVDFIKIDCEGYEEMVLHGAKQTTLNWKPTFIVEQKQHKMAKNFGSAGTPAVDLLLSWGGRLVQEIGGDYIVVFR